MLVDKDISLQAYNSLHIAAHARHLVHIRSSADVSRLLGNPKWASQAKFVIGGGSNVVLGQRIETLLLKVEIFGRCQIGATDEAWIVQAGAGENWHDFVAWTLQQGLAGLENLALIPGTVGAAPVQNIGAYGLELQHRFHSLDAIDLDSGQLFSLNAEQCAFAYRDSIFKRSGPVVLRSGQPSLGWRNKALILQVRLALPKRWQPVLHYSDLAQKMAQHNISQPSAQQVFDWVCQIRRAKLPDPRHIGNVGSFFKNPVVSTQQCQQLLRQHPKLVSYPLADGSFKLAAGWLIDACGWRGKRLGQAGVYPQQALVLINCGSVNGADAATGAEIMALARAIQTSVWQRFAVWLEPEPVVLMQ